MFSHLPSFITFFVKVPILGAFLPALVLSACNLWALSKAIKSFLSENSDRRVWLYPFVTFVLMACVAFWGARHSVDAAIGVALGFASPLILVPAGLFFRRST